MLERNSQEVFHFLRYTPLPQLRRVLAPFEFVQFCRLTYLRPIEIQVGQPQGDLLPVDNNVLYVGFLRHLQDRSGTYVGVDIITTTTTNCVAVCCCCCYSWVEGIAVNARMGYSWLIYRGCSFLISQGRNFLIG